MHLLLRLETSVPPLSQELTDPAGGGPVGKGGSAWAALIMPPPSAT